MFFIVFLTSVVCSAAQTADLQMRGIYEKEGHHEGQLLVTSDKMVLTLGSDKLALDYRVLRVTGSDVTVQLTFAGDATQKPFKFNLVISVRDDLLYIEPRADHVGGFLGEGGVWTRK